MKYTQYVTIILTNFLLSMVIQELYTNEETFIELVYERKFCDKKNEISTHLLNFFKYKKP